MYALFSVRFSLPTPVIKSCLLTGIHREAYESYMLCRKAIQHACGISSRINVLPIHHPFPSGGRSRQTSATRFFFFFRPPASALLVGRPKRGDSRDGAQSAPPADGVAARASEIGGRTFCGDEAKFPPSLSFLLAAPQTPFFLRPRFFPPRGESSDRFLAVCMGRRLLSLRLLPTSTLEIKAPRSFSVAPSFPFSTLQGSRPYRLRLASTVLRLGGGPRWPAFQQQKTEGGS